MALTPEIRAPQGGTFITVRQSTPQMRAPQAGSFVSYNVPAYTIASTYGDIHVAFNETANVSVTQAMALVAIKGRTASPNLRAWTFSLDGHDYYVLRLGDKGTLIYDTYSEQWYDWRSSELPFWRPNIGMNWVGAQNLGETYGSNVILGDDTFGLLWVLDPTQGYDEHPDYSRDENQYFERVVMGQVPMRGRDFVPCDSVILTASMGAPSFTGATVLLETSDDAGKTFQAQEALEVVEADYSQLLFWGSLGQMGSPGRLFKFTDYGAVARIDGMELNDGEQ